MFKPLTQFRCDSCLGVIDSPREGWLEWHVINRTKYAKGYHIVHRSDRCTYDATLLRSEGKTVIRVPLNEVVDSRALGCLLRQMDALCTRRSPFATDARALIEIIRRLQLPYYEEARLFWDLALRASVHSGTEYSEDVLQSIVKWKDDTLSIRVAAFARDDDADGGETAGGAHDSPSS